MESKENNGKIISNGWGGVMSGGEKGEGADITQSMRHTWSLKES